MTPDGRHRHTRIIGCEASRNVPSDSALAAFDPSRPIKVASPDAEKRASAHPIRSPRWMVGRGLGHRRAIGPGESTNMRITRKLQLNTLMVLALLVLNGVVAIVLVQRMMRDVRQLAEVEQPLKEAVLEMEINVGETARAVLDYIRDHEEHDIDRMHDSERDFERFTVQFERLAETDDERELGRQVADLYRDFKTLGDEIVSMSRQRHDDLQMLRQDVARIDELIVEKLQPAIDHSAAGAITKLEAALEMEINIHETVAAIEGYILEASPEFKPKIVDSEADFNRFNAQYRGTRLSADEERWLDQIGRDFGEAVTAGNAILVLTDGYVRSWSGSKRTS